MYFTSTAEKASRKTLSQAILCGLAEDGGLFVPETFPQLDLHSFSPDTPYPDFAQQVLKPFFAQDPIEKHLSAFCRNAFNFPLPLKTINQNTFILELFHGPTLSFKDFGARFLAEALNSLSIQHKTTVMVATSGDTGSAVAAAFHLKPQIQVIVLYPQGKISARQEHQITCWGDNVLALAVDGTFDDCQALVKEAFRDHAWQKALHLSSANSINIGRLLPQVAYYAFTSLLFYKQHQQAAGFIVPTGNLGNATAAYWAKALGFPIREIVLSTNANVVIPDFIKTGHFTPRPSIATLANAMDVGNPSNFERLHQLYPAFATFQENVSAYSATDADIRSTIPEMYQQHKVIVCPHTATACFARKQLSAQPWIIVATADPCKFDDIIEPLLKINIPVAPQLQALLDKPTLQVPVGRNLKDLEQVLQKRGLL